jgi:AraC-type DNA-binding domain-containing proteins
VAGLRRLKDSVSFRIFLSLALEVAIAVIFLSLVIFLRLQGKAQEDIDRNAILMLRNVRTALSGYKEQFVGDTRGLYQNPYIKEMLLSQRQEWSDRVAFATDMMSAELRTNNYLTTIMLIRQDGSIAWQIDNTPLSKVSNQRVVAAVISPSETASPIFLELDRMTATSFRAMIVAFPGANSNGANVDGRVAMVVNLDDFAGKILETAEGGAQSISILDDRGAAFLGPPVPDAPSLLSSIRAIGSDRGSLSVGSGGSSSHYAYLRDPSLGLSFVSRSDIGSSVRELRGMGTFLLIAGLALIALAVVGSFFVSRRLYRPLGALFGLIRSAASEEPAAADGELKQLSSLLSSALGRMSSLQSRQAEQELISALAESGCPRTEISESTMRQLRLPIEGARFVIALAYLAPGDTGFPSEVSSLQLESAAAIFGEALRGDVSGIASGRILGRAFVVPRRHIAIVAYAEASSGASPEFALRDRVASARSSIRELMGVEVQLGISDSSDDRRDLRRLYEEALDAAWGRRFSNEGMLRSIAEARALDSSPLPPSLSDAALEALKDCDEAAYLSRIDALLDACRGKTRAVAASGLRALSSDLVSFGRELSLGEASARDEAAVVVDAIEAAESRGELVSLFARVYAIASSPLLKANKNRSRELVDSVKAYIAERYVDSSLSASSVAEEKGVSVSWFSRAFNEQTGSTFPEYVKGIRLEKAKELLASPSRLSVSAVAERVGFNNKAYFSQSFKEKFGLSPSQYQSFVRENKSRA